MHVYSAINSVIYFVSDTLAYNILRDLSEPKLAGLLMKGIKAVIWGLMVMVCLPTLWIIVFNGGG